MESIPSVETVFWLTHATNLVVTEETEAGNLGRKSWKLSGACSKTGLTQMSKATINPLCAGLAIQVLAGLKTGLISLSFWWKRGPMMS